MTEVEPVLDFASSGRSGRRNALPDILGSPAGVNPGDLPLKLAELSLKEAGGRPQQEFRRMKSSKTNVLKMRSAIFICQTDFSGCFLP
uniref:cAMP-dependent protein kinase inhibitor beta n=1 Tax=Oryzias melastigma TaxID=30732 RepID=A0A3B3DVQ3_ORYME